MYPSTEYTKPDLSRITAKIEQFESSENYTAAVYPYKPRINKSGDQAQQYKCNIWQEVGCVQQEIVGDLSSTQVIKSGIYNIIIISRKLKNLNKNPMKANMAKLVVHFRL